MVGTLHGTASASSATASSPRRLRIFVTVEFAAVRIVSAHVAGDAIGATDSPEHESWKGMKARCYYPKNVDYHNYGGRGIRVCERWRTSFENFLTDVGERPSPKHSLDRYPNQSGHQFGSYFHKSNVETS